VSRIFVIAGLVALSSTARAKPAPQHHRTTTSAREKSKVAHDPGASPSVTAAATVEPPKPPPGLTLGAGAVLVSTSLEVSLAKGSPVAPASFAPDVSAGITDDLTLSLVTSASAMTGFRGSAGFGFCFTGELDGKCRKPVSGGGAELLYSLSRGSFASAANAGILATTIDPVHTDLKLGFKTKLTVAQTYALFSPSVWIALDDRTDPMLPHEHQVFAPFSLWQKLVPAFAVGVGTGIKGPVARFSSRWAVPLGIAAQINVDQRASVGASFVFGRVLAGSEVMDPGLDARVFQLWLSVASR
jgi:hypothetical protein